MQEYLDTERPICCGCTLPILHEPMEYYSHLNIRFIAHDFDCLMSAHEKAVKQLMVRDPQAVETWLEETAL